MYLLRSIPAVRVGVFLCSASPLDLKSTLYGGTYIDRYQSIRSTLLWSKERLCILTCIMFFVVSATISICLSGESQPVFHTALHTLLLVRDHERSHYATRLARSDVVSYSMTDRESGWSICIFVKWIAQRTSFSIVKVSFILLRDDK